ncbi:MAG: YceD family protein [Sutterellaceae bacterium]|nr:YceD family protein [Sutterellaceae bacterium]
MQYVDIFELSRARSTIEGTLTAADLPEAFSLLEGVAKDIQVSYKAQGTAGRRELAGADLILDATVVTACVRCSKPVTIRIEKTVPFLFTKTEKEADAMPIEDDEEFEIVVGSRKFDIAHWVEEEIILSLPQFAQHDDCEPDRELLQTEETEETVAKPNPFACLAALKTKK